MSANGGKKSTMNGYSHVGDDRGEADEYEDDPMLEEVATAPTKEMMCGLGSWRPFWLQPFANIKTFTLVLSMWSLFGSVNFAYFSSAITQIEREFGLPSSVTGFIKNVDNLGFMATVLIFSHFCRDSNKPRLFAAATVLSSGAIFLFAVPHFIYGQVGRDFSDVILPNATTPRSKNIEFCDGVTEVGGGEQFCRSGSMQTLNTGALVIFIISELIQGVAQSPKMPLSLTYMDDNAKDDSPKYFSCMFSMRAFSPVLGYMLGAWTSTLYVTLNDPGFGAKDPRWVGAWWLGFVICAVVSVVWALPMLLFPPVLKDAKGQAIDTTHQKDDLAEKAKDLPRALARLVRNKLFVVLLLGLAFDLYLMGFFTFLPKYFEQYYGVSPAVASLATGTIAAVAIGMGPIIGGRIVTVNKKITPFGSTKIIMTTTLCSLVGYIIMMFLACPDAEWAGNISKDNPDLRLECNGNCSCDSNAYVPVCGDNGINYFSPCHAGCTEEVMINGTMIYSGCNCTEGGTAQPGTCPKQCTTLIPFAIMLFLTKLISSIDKIPTMTLFMRCVDYRDKALSIALAGMFLQVVGFPAPIVFGYILDSACLVTQGACAKRRRGGACLLYDNDAVRFRVHAAAILLKCGALVFYAVALFISRRPEYNQVLTAAGRPEKKKGALQNEHNDTVTIGTERERLDSALTSV